MAMIAIALCMVAVFILQVPFPSLVEGAPRQKKIVLYQKEDHVVGTEYGMSDDGQAPGGFTERVNGENSRGAIPSYIRGYERRYAEDRPYVWAKGKNIFSRGDYTVLLHICEIHQDPKTTYALSTGNCDSLLGDNGGRDVQSVGHIYVSNNGNPRHDEADPIKFVAKLCQTSTGVLYGTVSLGTGFCHGRHRAVREYGFYAHGGDKFCPILRNSYMTVTYERDGNGRETAASVRCNRGYRLVHGEVDRVRCGSDGRWEGSRPVCRLITCGEGPRVDHGKYQGNSRDFGSSLSLACDQGYEGSGSILRCEALGQWEGHHGTCDRISCVTPTNPINGRVTGAHKFQDEIRYECSTGYRLEGAANATCQANRRWSSRPPRCQKIVCPTLRQPAHGLFRQSDFALGSRVIFECHVGYILRGQSQLTCDKDRPDHGVWSHPAPTCEAYDCGQPASLQDGNIAKTDGTTYNQRIQFSCNSGFRMIGSDFSRCTMQGWHPAPAVCQAITCHDLESPENGQLSGDDFTAGSSVTFSCNVGYRITGTRTVVCQLDGQWDSRAPRCMALECPPLPSIGNGTRTAGVMEYGAGVTFSCLPGFELIGNRNTTCLSDQRWSHPVPTCRACPLGQYKEGVDGDRCQPCPQHSMTLVPASSSIDHCICQVGMHKSSDGRTCQAQTCPALNAPDNGFIRDCSAAYGGVCSFSCNPGYILRGHSETLCSTNGWTQQVPFCEGCPVNTYKRSNNSQVCHPCPQNTYTNGRPGTSIADCVCRDGYDAPQEGAVCTDVNECAENNGGCSHVCENTHGNYTCLCDIPGHQIGPDGHTCYAAMQCPDRPQNPVNGELNCRYNEQDNGHICFIQCDPGNYFVSGQNNYITCGQETGFLWSHRMVNSSAEIPGCTEEFFVDTQLPIDFVYTSSSGCSALNETAEGLAVVLGRIVANRSLCGGSCSVSDMGLHCQEGDGGDIGRVRVAFKLQVKNLEVAPVGSNCSAGCKQMNMRQILVSTVGVSKALEALVKSASSDLHLPNLPGLRVDTDSYNMGRLDMMCHTPGRVLTNNRLCVPCDSGFYLADRADAYCTPCPKGTYQMRQGKTSCIQCPEDATTLTVGSAHATMCSVRMSVIGGEGFSLTRASPLHVDPYLDEDLDDFDIDVILRFV